MADSTKYLLRMVLNDVYIERGISVVIPDNAIAHECFALMCNELPKCEAQDLLKAMENNEVKYFDGSAIMFGIGATPELEVRYELWDPMHKGDN